LVIDHLLRPRTVWLAVLVVSVFSASGGSGLAAAAGFYANPAHLGHYRVGQPIKTTPLGSAEKNLRRAGRVMRFMYRSESATGAPRAETGLIVVPHGRAPEGGWPVVAWDHGTNGVGPACAPSRSPDLSLPAYGKFVASLAAAGNVVVAPDYEGLGVAGEVSPYAELESEGRSTIDAVRAAHDLLPDLTRGWVVIGHSQGGQAALGTSQLAGTRAPQYPLLGTVPMAPASHLAQALDILNKIKPPKLNTLPEIAYLLLSVKVSDPTFDPATVVSPGMVAGLRRARTGCFNEVEAWYSKHRPAVMFKRSWRDSEPLRLFVSRNAPGAVLSTGPLFLAQGTGDKVVAPQLTAALDQHLCQIGDTVDFTRYPGVEHVPLVGAAADAVLEWVAGRFVGTPATSNCAGPTPEQTLSGTVGE
jgi:pimeloyl-ACP methyl ester carboxylesterase